MSNGSGQWAGRIVSAFASKWAWRIVLGGFIAESLWLVFSAQYPMAFDENYHFGLIQLHAQQWLPFFTSQPDDVGQYGALVRDPSYLFHWIMSFPYRFIALFTDSQAAQVIFLRLFNVAFFAYGLVLYRKVVARLGVSAALSNALLAVFILIPVVPFLAAHINYDNLLLISVPLAVLLTLDLMDGFKRRKVEAGTLLALIALLLASSLIKYPFLPVFVVIAIVLLWRLWRDGLLNRAGWQSFAGSFGKLSRVTQIALVLACLLSFGLFAERYAINVVRYHDPVPACDKVISLQLCREYGPFGRDYNYVQHKSPNFTPDVPWYVWQWFRGMWHRLFFAIAHTYANEPPLFVISRLAIALVVLGVIGVAARFRAIFAGQRARQLVLWVILGYVVVLFLDGLSAYAKTGVAVAINGRYLIPFMPFGFALAGLAWSQLLRKWLSVKAMLAALVIAVFILQGGGTTTFIVRSQDWWFWNNSAVRSVNRAVRDAVSPVIIGKDIKG